MLRPRPTGLARSAIGWMCAVGLITAPLPAAASPAESGAPESSGPASPAVGAAEDAPGEPSGDEDDEFEYETGAEPDAEAPSSEASGAESGALTGEAPAQPDARPADADEYEVEQPERERSGVGGPVIDADDPGASAAQDQLEGDRLNDPASTVPERMEPLQAAAWWTMFGSVALGSAGGVFAGLAEREEDRAGRLARSFDSDLGRRELYADVASEYEDALDRGEAFAWTSRGFLIAGGLALTASIALFAVHARRDRAAGRSARLRRVGPGGMEIAF